MEMGGMKGKLSISALLSLVSWGFYVLNDSLIETCQWAIMNVLRKWKWKSLSHVWLFLTPWLLCPWNSPGQNTGVGSCSLLQGIFPTQESNPGLPYCRWILYYLSHQGIPRKLEWIAYLFFRGSSQPRNRTQVSYLAGRFFTSWATREASAIKAMSY